MSAQRIEALKAQLRQIEELARSGALTDTQAAEARQRLERELLDLVMAASGDAAGPNAAAAAPSAAPTAQPPAQQAPSARPSRQLVTLLAAGVVVLTAALYTWLGNFEGWGVAPGTPAGATDASRAGHDTGMAQIEAMTQKLSERLQAQPEDAEGWSMLGRSYSVLNRFGDAVPAFRKVIELRPQDAQAHADLADALGMVNGRSLEGEPSDLIDKALKLDGSNMKALSLAGTIAFMRNDFAGAVRHWEKAVAVAEPGSEMVRNLQAGIDEARQKGKLPGGSPKAAAAATPAPGTKSEPAAVAGAQVSGKVTLSASLKDKAAPDDTVFIFARAAEGPRMPLAIVRKQVKDLPISFTLDDSMAMSPAAKLSGAPMVVVGARVSKSGNAMPQPGDLQGVSQPVKPGASGLAIEINEAVK